VDKMKYEIIDFHTHPFASDMYNICQHRNYPSAPPMNADETARTMAALGVSRIAGSVITGKNDRFSSPWEKALACNEEALALRERYGDFYIPGFHVHPAYVEQSCREIERMAALGVRLVGELVPYMDDWGELDYACGQFSQILDSAEEHGMVVSFHTMNDEAVDKMVAAHPKTVFVAAHPGDYGSFERHMARMEMSENYYLDLSGTGLFRQGLLRHGIDRFGAERFIYGSDFPTCNPAMFIGGVALDPLLDDAEREKIFSGNARRLLGL